MSAKAQELSENSYFNQNNLFILQGVLCNLEAHLKKKTQVVTFAIVLIFGKTALLLSCLTN